MLMEVDKPTPPRAFSGETLTHLAPEEWDYLLDHIKEEKRFLSGPLDVVRYRIKDPNTILLRFLPDQGLHCDTIKSADSIHYLQEAFAKKGFPLTIEVEMDTLQPSDEEIFSQSAQEMRNRRYLHVLNQLKQEAREHPRVKQIMALIPGIRLRDVKPLAPEPDSPQNGES
jgi:hypothetical protein